MTNPAANLESFETSGTAPASPAAIAVYQALASHWSHSEQVRWTLIYNYSMASTVLLLAWAAVYASSVSQHKTLVLISLAAAGLILTAVWLVLQLRANGFVHAFAQAGRTAERALGARLQGPFVAAHAHRETIWTKNIGTRVLAPAVLGIFALVYAVLLWISFGAA